MALRFIEGFDHYGAALASVKGWGGLGSLSMVGGRLGGQAIKSTATSNGVLSKNGLGCSDLTSVVGAAFLLSNPTVGADLVQLYTLAGAFVGRLGYGTGGKLIVRNGAGTTIATGTTTISSSTWYYAEMKIFANGASGTCEVHLNGVSGEIASTVGNFGSATVDIVGVVAGGSSSQNQHAYDDVYVLDGGGTTNNDFLGDVRVNTLLPNASGAYTQFTPLSSTNVSNVDDPSADGDTTYNFDGNVGDIDTYTTGGVSALATVYGVQSSIYARKDDAGARTVVPLARQASIDYPGSASALGTGYLFYSQFFDQDPAGANWTPANLNADEFGYKVTA